MLSSSGPVPMHQITAAVESSAMPKNQPCIMCPEAALYRCIQCGTNAYYTAMIALVKHTIQSLSSILEMCGRYIYM